MTTRRRGALWAVVRLSSFDRGGLVPALAVASSALVVVALALTAGHLPLVVGAQLEREAARSPVVDEEVIGRTDRSAVVEADLRLGSRVVRSYRVAAVGDAVGTPPGLDRLPGPGQVAASPALLALADRDLHVAQLIDADAPAAVIADEGLTGPGELVLWMGVQRTAFEPDQPELLGFGEPVVLPEFLHRSYWPIYGAAVVLLLGLPLLVLTQAAVRASEAARRQRAAALRLLGAPLGLVRAVNVVEVAAPSLVGSVLGALLFTAATRTGSVAARVFPGDLTGWGRGSLLAVAVVPALMTVSALLATRGSSVSTAGPRPRFVPDAPVRRPVLATLALLGVVGAAVATRRSGGLAASTTWWAVSMLASVVALSAGSRWVVVRTAALLASRATRPTLVAALRRVECHGHAPLAVGLLVGIVTAGAVAFGPIVTSLVGQEHIAADHLRLRERLPTTVAFVETVRPLDVASDSPGHARVDVRGMPRPEGGTERVVVASCDAVRNLLSSPVLACEHALWRLGVADDDSGGHTTKVWVPGAGYLPLEATVDSGRLLDDLSPWTVLAPDTLPDSGGEIPLEGHLVAIPSNADAIDALRVAVAQQAPGANLYVPYDPGIVGAGRWRPVAVLGAVLVAMSLVLSLIATTLVLAPLTAARHRTLRAWTIIGAPDRFLRGSQWLAYWFPAAFPTVAGAGFGLVAVAQARAISLVAPDTTLWGGAGIALLVVAGLAVACAVAALAPAPPTLDTGG